MDTDCAVRWDGDLRQIDKRVSYAIDQSDIQAKVEKEVEQVAKKKKVRPVWDSNPHALSHVELAMSKSRIGGQRLTIRPTGQELQ